MTPLSYWIWFHIAIAALMGVEYLLHLAFPDPRRKATYALILWTAAALSLAAVLHPHFGSIGSTQYLAGFAIEQALSVDNLLVFLLLFRLFRIQPRYQPRVLFFGIIGAMLMRGVFIAAGLGLLARFQWVSYIFAVILLVAAVRLFIPEAPDAHTKPPAWLNWITRLHPVSQCQDCFFIRESPGPGLPPRRMVTVLFLALLAVEFTDVVFALDSIPAVLSITRDPFLAYTSNIMAIMGLRSLYVLLATMLGSLRFLHIGLATLLGFAAVKMLIAKWYEIGPIPSLEIIAAVLAITIAASLLAPAKPEAV
ncbi:MAG: TerC/Alx family metal homeostasis membrane protein [Acidobacteriota bacterium]